MRTWFEFNDTSWETPDVVNQSSVCGAEELSSKISSSTAKSETMSSEENLTDSSSVLTSEDEMNDDTATCKPPNIVSKSGVLDLSVSHLIFTIKYCHRLINFDY